MSRSLVGSSSSSTFGSPISSRSSCSRRRSPPDRSPTRVVSRSPVKPKSSSRLVAVTSLPDATWVTRRSAADQVQHPLAGGQLADGLGQVADVDGPAALDPAGVRRQLPGEQPQQGGLAGSVDADQPDPVARADRPGQVLDQGPVAGRSARSRRSGRRRPCRAGSRRTAPARAGPAAAARPRSARWPRRSGTSASRSGPARPGAARPAPCAAGSCAGWPAGTPGGTARPGPARTPRSRRRTRRRRRRGPPRPGSRRRPGTTGRG